MKTDRKRTLVGHPPFSEAKCIISNEWTLNLMFGLIDHHAQQNRKISKLQMMHTQVNG